MFPDMLGRSGVKDPLSVEKGSDAAGGRLDFVRAARDKFGCQFFHCWRHCLRHGIEVLMISCTLLYEKYLVYYIKVTIKLTRGLC